MTYENSSVSRNPFEFPMKVHIPKGRKLRIYAVLHMEVIPSLQEKRESCLLVIDLERKPLKKRLPKADAQVNSLAGLSDILRKLDHGRKDLDPITNWFGKTSLGVMQRWSSQM